MSATNWLQRVSGLFIPYHTIAPWKFLPCPACCDVVGPCICSTSSQFQVTVPTGAWSTQQCDGCDSLLFGAGTFTLNHVTKCEWRYTDHCDKGSYDGTYEIRIRIVGSPGNWYIELRLRMQDDLSGDYQQWISIEPNTVSGTGTEAGSPSGSFSGDCDSIFNGNNERIFNETSRLGVGIIPPCSLHTFPTYLVVELVP